MSEIQNTLRVTSPSDNRVLKVNGTDARLNVTEPDAVKILTIGVQGVAGASGQGFVHDQLSPQTVWIVTHNLQKNPSVTVVDSGDSTVVGEVQYLDLNTLQLTFSAPFSGKAYIN